MSTPTSWTLLIHSPTFIHLENPFIRGLVRNYVHQNNLAWTKLQKWPNLAELRRLSSRHIVSHLSTNPLGHFPFRPNSNYISYHTPPWWAEIWLKISLRPFLGQANMATHQTRSDWAGSSGVHNNWARHAGCVRGAVGRGARHAALRVRDVGTRAGAARRTGRVAWALCVGHGRQRGLAHARVAW